MKHKPSNLDAAQKASESLDTLHEIMAKDSTRHMDKIALRNVAGHITELTHAYRALLAAREKEPVSFDELRDAVAEVTGVSPIEWRTGLYPGHHEVPFINFNSLGRIVDKFTHPAPSIPAAVPELSKVIYHFRDWNEGFPVERFKADYVISWMLANYPPAIPASVPEGYALVPVEPTEKMVIEGFESEPDEFFSEPDAWEAYDAMSGCQQAAHRAKLCWAAMIAAAPKEVPGE